MDHYHVHHGKGNCVEIVPIFATLTPEELDEVGAITFDRTYQKGEAVYRAGDRKGKLYLIHTGRVRVYRLSPDGKEQVTRMIGPGQFLGELSLFSTLSTTDYAAAAEETELCMIEGGRLKQLMGAHPSIALKVMEELSKRLEEAESLIEDINLRTVEQRLARFLLAESGGQPRVLPPHVQRRRRFPPRHESGNPEPQTRRLPGARSYRTPRPTRYRLAG